MRKIILDFENLDSREDIQNYLAEKFDFPDYYGMSLDALYDCLTDIDEYTCVGVFLPEFPGDEVESYLNRMIRVFLDSERENRHLGVIIADRESGEMEEEEDWL